jgi:hypothetical protein
MHTTGLSAEAQRPDMAAADTSRARLAPLTWLVGEWSGPAKVTAGPQTLTLTQRESVVEAANGTVLMIQGRGTMTGPDGKDREVFQAAGMLTYDVAARRFTWISSGGTGFLGVTEAVVTGNAFVWNMKDGSGNTVRYTISRTPEGAWREVGEFAKDGGWIKTFEMTLTKQR